MIYFISLFWLLLALLTGYRKPALALPFLISLQLLIPNVIKFNLGINMNIFNLSVLLFLFISFESIKSENPQIKNIRDYLKGYMFYVFLYSFLASLGNYSLSEYFQNMMLFFFEYIGMAYCLTYVRIDKKDIRFFNIAVVVSSVVIIIYGILNYVLKLNPYMLYVSTVADLDVDMANTFMEEQRGFLDGRISSTFQHPLQLGQAALLLFSYILYELKDKMNKLLYVLVLVGLVAMCILCGSRSAVFPLLVSAFFYLRFMKRRKVLLYITIFLLAFSYAYSEMPRDVQKTLKAMVFVWDEKASEKADIHGSSISSRTDQYMAALKIIDNRIFWGYGNGYVKNHGDKHPEMYGYESVVLKELVDGGLLGMLFFIVFYILMYKSFLNRSDSPVNRARIHSLCGSFLLSAFLTGVSYSFFSLYMIFCFVSYYSFSVVEEKNVCHK